MNTLTNFIDAQFSTTESTTATKSMGINEGSNHEAATPYEVIENQSFTGNTFNDLALSGSLFSLTTFTDVLFESCAFYASKIENCTFINVKFENCIFEFTQMQHCNFNNCTFENCIFQVSSIAKSTFAYSTYEGMLKHLIEKGGSNKVIACQEPEVLTWEEVLSADSTLEKETAAVGQGDNEVASLKIGLFGVIEEAFSKIKAA